MSRSAWGPPKVGEYYGMNRSVLGNRFGGYMPKLGADGKWEMVPEKVKSDMSWGGKNVVQQGMKYFWTDDQLQRINDYNAAVPQIQYEQQQAAKPQVPNPAPPPPKGSGGSNDRDQSQGSGGAGSGDNILTSNAPMISPKGENSVLTSTPQGGKGVKKGGALSSNILTDTPSTLGANAADAQKKKNLLGA